MAEGLTGKYTWEALKSMPTKRVFSTPVELDGKLYVIGGCDQRGTPVDSFEVYNPGNGKWTRLLNMPTPRAGCCGLSVEGKLYAFGGVAVNQAPLEAVEMYDPAAKLWTVKESMRDKLLGVSGVVRGFSLQYSNLRNLLSDGKCIIVGGMSVDTNPKDYLMSFDPETNLWQSLPPMPTPRYATFSFLIGNKLYVAGGRQGKLPVVAFEVFDFETQKWRKLPDIPSKRVFALYIASDTHIFCIGGLKENPAEGFSDATEAFDLEKEEWFIGENMPTKRGDFAIGIIGGRVIAAGGLGNDGKPSDAAEAYDLASNKWSPLSPIPSRHCSCAFINFKNKLHIVGGLTIGGPSAAMEALGCN